MGKAFVRSLRFAYGEYAGISAIAGLLGFVLPRDGVNHLRRKAGVLSLYDGEVGYCRVWIVPESESHGDCTLLTWRG